MLKKLIKFIKRVFGADLELLIAYICGGEALPQPLEPEEERKLIIKLGEGDESAKNTLIERNLRLVVYIAKKFENTRIDMDDLISVGAIGLIKAVGSFDTTKNIKLATYASRCIENEILMYLRKVTKHKQEVSLDEPLNFDKDGNELLLADVLATENDIVSKDIELNAEKQLLMCAIGKLNPREQQIMCLRFGLKQHEESTQKEVADMLGISQSYISRIEKKVLTRLKKEIS
ncbi:MAG: RNA polymerase sporulation sigma factor SigE [Christensenellaceae bacterium]|jgi:RNA polymerase sporulation-specific sigma factor|nr:RNA polymerase sporulation sigma factor SigE [Christensenellaceae bacterium]